MAFPIDPTEYMTEALRVRLEEQNRHEKATQTVKMRKEKPKAPIIPPQSSAAIQVELKRSASVAEGPRFLPKDYSDTASIDNGDNKSYDNYSSSHLRFDLPLAISASTLVMDGSNNNDTKRRVHGLEGHSSTVDLASMLRIVPSEQVSPDPIVADDIKCCGYSCKHRYHVSKGLDVSYELQSRFLKYIAMGYVFQILTVIAWIVLISLLDNWGQTIKENFNWAYVPLGVFFFSKSIVRTQTQIRKTHPVAQIVAIVLKTLCIAYYCGAVKVVSTNFGSIISITLCILLQSTAFFAWTANYVAYNVTSREIIGMTAAVTAVFSLTIFIALGTYAYEQQEMVVVLVYNWIPSVISSELISVCVMFEIRQLMRGWRFPLAQADWIFALLYI